MPAWVQSGEIAIPEIQRPFIRDATNVRNLLDSLYQGYQVGYLIAWRNPSETCFSELAEQCNDGEKKYDDIIDMEQMRANLRRGSLPDDMLDGQVPDCGEFVEQRRVLIAQNIQTYFEGL